MSGLNFENAYFGDNFISEWEMTDFERVVFSALVERLRPRFALEIGSRNGGSLQILERYCQRIVSLDIDETVPVRLKERFPTVEFQIGDSRVLLPQVLTDMQKKNELPDFIFIDGDHTTEGAARDLHHVLSIVPATRTWVLMHDTFNPDVRTGVRSVLEKGQYSHVHFAALDFAPGILLSSGPLKGEIWGGFSLFILEPIARTGQFNWSQEWQNMWSFISSDIARSVA